MTVVIDGSNGVDIGAGNLTFPDDTTQTTTPIDVGVGQTWQDVTASRTSGTVYTNNTGKPIMFRVRVQGIPTVQITLTVGGVSLGISSFSVGGLTASYFDSAIVPDGATYSATANAGSLSLWLELR